MPAPNAPTPTLAQLISDILLRQDVILQARRDMASAMRAFAKLAGRQPSDIIADPAVIRCIAAETPWKLAGYSKARWANILASLSRAMALAGVKVHRQRRNYQLTPAWEARLAPLQRRDRDEVRRFAGWCSVLGVAPVEVTSETFDQFLRYMEEQSIQRNPRERVHVARRAWNRAIASSGSPFVAMPAPQPVAPAAIRWIDCSQSMQADVAAYAEWVTAKDPFDDEREPIKQVTLTNYLTRLRVLLTALIDLKMPLESFTSLSALVDPALIKRGLEHRLGTRELDDTRRRDLHGILVPVLSVARYLKVDDAQLAQLRSMAKKMEVRAQGMCERNQLRLRPLKAPSVRNKLLRLPLAVASDLEKVSNPNVRQAQRMQMAVLLEILLHVPMRIRNAAALDMASTLGRPLPGSKGKWHIAFPAVSVKNKVPIDAALNHRTGQMIARYVDVFRAVLVVQPTTSLFIGQNGKPKGPSALSKQLARFVWREAGIRVHAHLMRHLAAYLFLLVNPGQFEAVRRILGHKNLDTTMAFYEGQQTDNAFECYDATVERLRNEDEDKL